MIEVTRIITARITVIAKADDETQVIPKEKAAKSIIEDIKDLGADDVVVDNVQDFIRDIEPTGEDADGTEKDVCENDNRQ